MKFVLRKIWKCTPENKNEEKKSTWPILVKDHLKTFTFILDIWSYFLSIFDLEGYSKLTKYELIECLKQKDLEGLKVHTFRNYIKRIILQRVKVLVEGRWEGVCCHVVTIIVSVTCATFCSKSRNGTITDSRHSNTRHDQRFCISQNFFLLQQWQVHRLRIDMP